MNLEFIVDVEFHCFLTYIVKGFEYLGSYSGYA